MRLHVVGLPHTQTTREYDWCAYTAKVRRLGGMLRSCGHEVVLYAGTDNEADVDEHVVAVRAANLVDWFGGPWDQDRVFDQYEPDRPCWRDMNRQVITLIRNRIEPGDAIGIIAGRCQQEVVDAFPDHLKLEWGVGYVGVLPNTFRAFESHTHQAYVHGWHRDDDGRMFDTVIPNAFDVADFAPVATRHDDYLLYLGRPAARKGLAVVEELAKRYKVITAGQGGGTVDGAEHVGLVRGRCKAELLANARAVLVPTLYVEPFGGVAVEAMMAGTPAITTDFGAFTETVEHALTGFRCSTLGDFIHAVESAHLLDPHGIARRARARFSTEAVAPLYDRWLRRLGLLAGDGWYSVA